MQATKEMELAKQLENIQLFWLESKFTLEIFRDQKDNYMLADNEDIVMKIDESIEMLNNIASSKYIEPMKLQV